MKSAEFLGLYINTEEELQYLLNEEETSTKETERQPHHTEDRGSECSRINVDMPKTNVKKGRRLRTTLPQIKKRARRGKRQGRCFQFGRTGTCPRGVACRYHHICSIYDLK